MAAPKENQFWKIRSKHGRDRLFQSSNLLWNAACEYFNWCDGHPWYKNEPIKSGDMAGKVMKVNIARPYTITGLCIYLNCNSAYFRQFKASLPKDEKDFSTVISQIEEIIYTQKFEGAAVGAFNANIIARDLGLADKNESRRVDKDGNDVPETPGLNITIVSPDANIAESEDT